MRRKYAVLPAVLLLVAAPRLASAQTDRATRTVANGITFTQEITHGNAPLVVNILRVNLNAPGVKLRCGLALDCISLTGATRGREPLNTLAIRSKAIAAVNADFFPYTGDPLGLAVRDGELVSEPMAYRACLGIAEAGVRLGVLSPVGALAAGDGFPIAALDGINRVPHPGDLIVLTPTYAATPALEANAVVLTLQNVNLPLRASQAMQGVVTSVIPLQAGTHLPRCPAGGVLIVGCGKTADILPERFKEGDAAQFRFDLVSSGAAPNRGKYASRAGSFRSRPAAPLWSDVQQAVGGGPFLVRDGKIAVDGEAEGFDLREFVVKRHPRTAVGVTRDNKLLVVTVDGRQEQSRGVSLNELAAMMQHLGAVNALNLDGGGSTGLFVAGGIVNGPSDGRLRPIADSLLIYGENTHSEKTSAARTDPANFHIAPNPVGGATLRVGDTLTFRLVDAQGHAARIPVIWGTKDGLGFITQSGAFRSRYAGSTEIIAAANGLLWRVPVSIQSGEPAAIAASLRPLANYPPDYKVLVVLVRDKFGNPVNGLKVQLTIEGGQTDDAPVTNAGGEARAQILWNALPGARKVTIRAGNAPPLVVRN